MSFSDFESFWQISFFLAITINCFTLFFHKHGFAAFLNHDAHHIHSVLKENKQRKRATTPEEGV